MADSEEPLDDLYIQEEPAFDWAEYMRTLVRPIRAVTPEQARETVLRKVFKHTGVTVNEGGFVRGGGYLTVEDPPNTIIPLTPEEYAAVKDLVP